jgi:predicted ATP-dependent serine protease
LNYVIAVRSSTGVGGLVGRHRELAQVQQMVQAVAGGRGGMLLVEGEPGIGKTALLAGGLRGARALGCEVLSASADETGRRFALQVMLDCLRVDARTVAFFAAEEAGYVSGQVLYVDGATSAVRA